jgi:hypothetical protein
LAEGIRLLDETRTALWLVNRGRAFISTEHPSMKFRLVEWDVTGDPHELYEEVEGVCGFTKTTAEAFEEDADAVEERLRADGANPTGRRPMEIAESKPLPRRTWINTPDGWVWCEWVEGPEGGEWQGVDCGG